MLKNQYEINFININGEETNLLLRRFKKQDAKRLYMSWSNPQSYRFNEIPKAYERLSDGTIKTGVDLIADMADYDWPSSFGQYYFVIEDKSTKNIIGNVRIGTLPWDKKYKNRTDVWGFGYNIVRSDDKEVYTLKEIKNAFKNNGITKDEKTWGKGYATAIIKFILEIAKQQGINKVVSGADILNYGSIKPMLKNGMTFVGIDDDLDPTLEIDLTKPIIIPTKDQLKLLWDEYQNIVNKTVEEKSEQINKNTQKHYNQAILRWREAQEITSKKEK